MKEYVISGFSILMKDTAQGYKNTTSISNTIKLTATI